MPSKIISSIILFLIFVSNLYGISPEPVTFEVSPELNQIWEKRYKQEIHYHIIVRGIIDDFGYHKWEEKCIEEKNYIHIFVTENTIRILMLNKNGDYSHTEVYAGDVMEYQLWNTRQIEGYILPNCKQIILTQEQVEELAKYKNIKL